MTTLILSLCSDVNLSHTNIQLGEGKVAMICSVLSNSFLLNNVKYKTYADNILSILLYNILYNKIILK